MKPLCRVVAAQAWVSAGFFAPKLHLTTAYQPLISATFSPCDFYWCTAQEAGLSLHLTGVQIVLENSANISLHYPPPPTPITPSLSSPPFLSPCVFLASISLNRKGEKQDDRNQVEY